MEAGRAHGKGQGEAEDRKMLVTRPTLPASVFHIHNQTLPVPQGCFTLKQASVLYIYFCAVFYLAIHNVQFNSKMFKNFSWKCGKITAE